MRHAFIFILLPVLLCFAGPLSKKTIIRSVTENGHFILGDSEVVALANVRLPGAVPADTMYQKLVAHIRYDAQNKFKNRMVLVEYSGKDTREGYPLVHLTIWYPLQNTNINRYFLQHGFGWFTDNGDSTYFKMYRQAETFARVHEKGVWNPQKATDNPMQNELLSFHFGYAAGEEDKITKQYYSVSLHLQPYAATGSGLELDLSHVTLRQHGPLCCECDFFDGYVPEDETQLSTGTFFYAQYNQNWKYGGFSAGFISFYLHNMYCYEGPDMLVFPKLGGRLGWLNTFYVELGGLNPASLSMLSLSLNYVFSQQGDRLSVAASLFDEQPGVSLRLQMLLSPNLALIAEGAYSKDKSNPYAARIGLGYFIR